MPSPIPDRWLDYKPIGEKIEGTRFIAFKVPLKEHIARKVDNDIRLDGNILLKMIPNLGLIIDLTNTYRYYDPKIFQKEGVQHKKLMIPGHETPSKNLVDKFITIVKEFMEDNADNDKLIGVHCTHGVNRTGYLICNYMISQMIIDPNEAMDRFANARGHKIERYNYINALHKLLEANVQTNSIAEEKTEINNWRERSVEKVDNWRERKQSQNEANNYRKGNGEHPRNSNRDQCNREKRTHDNYRSRWDNNIIRPRSISPPPYYANNRRHDFYSHRRPTADDHHRVERPYYPVPPLPLPENQEQLRIPNHMPPYQQPPRLRLDYYNARPVDGSQRNNRNMQRFTYVRKTNNL